MVTARSTAWRGRATVPMRESTTPYVLLGILFTVIRGLSGHGVGRRIREEQSVPNYYDRWQTDVLTEGLVITIEPLVCAGSGKVTGHPA